MIVEFKYTSALVADAFTKALPRDKLQYLVELMRMDRLQSFLTGCCCAFSIYQMVAEPLRVMRNKHFRAGEF